jgi:Uma2 family endonuclease
MIATISKPTFTLEDYLANPPEHQEWINGELQETTGMTVRHSELQLTLGSLWKNHLDNSQIGGKVYTELPCRTQKQGRRPDVSYLTPELVSNYRNAPSLPQSPPLIAEIVSPTDAAEDLFAKASEYLASGCEEVWLVFPENERILIIMSDQILAFSKGDIIATQKFLNGFQIAVNDLFS